MEQFSSCYFCGDAVDASLDEYPVVPASVDPDAGERRTIVLCMNCKRKLDPVVEAVVDAVGDAAVTVDRPEMDAGQGGAGPGSEGVDPDDDSTDGSPEHSGDRRSYTSGQRAGGQPTGQNGGGNDDGQEDDGKRDISLTRLENTNVMRLLQNREFPVEREEFVTVASSAYELSPNHCEKVLDLAVSHDLLRERDGELHAGPNWS
ncbi:MAG: hypothetical protein V5A44_03920 [Haloarculaceae archaeon]